MTKIDFTKKKLFWQKNHQTFTLWHYHFHLIFRPKKKQSIIQSKTPLTAIYFTLQLSGWDFERKNTISSLTVTWNLNVRLQSATSIGKRTKNPRKATRVKGLRCPLRPCMTVTFMMAENSLQQVIRKGAECEKCEISFPFVSKIFVISGQNGNFAWYVFCETSKLFILMPQRVYILLEEEAALLYWLIFDIMVFRVVWKILTFQSILINFDVLCEKRGWRKSIVMDQACTGCQI